MPTDRFTSLADELPKPTTSSDSQLGAKAVTLTSQPMPMTDAPAPTLNVRTMLPGVPCAAMLVMPVTSTSVSDKTPGVTATLPTEPVRLEPPLTVLAACAWPASISATAPATRRRPR